MTSVPDGRGVAASVTGCWPLHDRSGPPEFLHANPLVIRRDRLGGRPVAEVRRCAYVVATSPTRHVDLVASLGATG
jgi:hypothetical protein